LRIANKCVPHGEVQIIAALPK